MKSVSPSLKIMLTNEILDDLQNGYHIIQKTDGFKFGIDAVLLADFAKSVTGRVMDLCTGTGIIPLLLAAKSKATQIHGVEIQPDIADMANRSVIYNNLEDRIHIKCSDLKEAPHIYGKSIFDGVTVNPPYMKAGSGLINCADTKTISRHEIKCNLDDVIKTSSELLKPTGKMFMIHRPSRLVDVIYTMRSFGIEPKIIRFVAGAPNKTPNLVLIMGIKGAKSELKIMPTLFVRDENGEYSKEIDEIYGR